MGRSIEHNFSHVFDGTVWNLLASEKHDVLIAEVRNHEKKQVTFSACHCQTGQFLWRDVTFDEPWWINLAGVTGDVVLFTLYLETQNPDRKGVLAYHLTEQKILWWNNDLSLTEVSGAYVRGIASKYGHREVVLDAATGQAVDPAQAVQTPVSSAIRRPYQYLEENPHFATVKTFLEEKFNLSPVVALEYLEHGSLIFISFYLREEELANYLLVLSAEGNVLLKEKLDEQRKGIGLDTFFILSGCVFFVKNTRELDSYKIYD